jgi:hypothetical protein
MARAILEKGLALSHMKVPSGETNAADAPRVASRGFSTPILNLIGGSSAKDGVVLMASKTLFASV